MIKFTPEQGDVIDWVEENDGVLLVAAGAGTGKSFLAQQIAKLLAPVRGLYTAFNRAIVEEGIVRFRGTNMECKTFHALAYKFVQPKMEISDITYSCIEENLPYKDKYEIITTINSFFVSASTNMYDFFDAHFEAYEKPQLSDIACKYVEQMIEGKLNPTFNFMLKYLHLMLVEKRITIYYDLVILDEINDTTAVALEIFKLIDSPKKIGLGETHQAIYQFLNLVNGFEELEDVPIVKLTQSFRCSEKIASRIDKFMKKEVDEDFNFVGTTEPVANGKRLYCTGTNAYIIQEISDRLVANKGFYLLRKISEIFAAPLALMSARNGKKPYQKKYMFLMDEYKNWQEERTKGQSFFQYLLDYVDDKEIQNAVKLIMKLQRKNINLYELYKNAKDADVDPDYTIATVFTAKGLEYETVEIAEDLNNSITAVRENGGIKTEEDLVAYRCYYVACSRAGKELINATALNSGV